MNVLISGRHLLTETNRQSIRINREYIVLTKYRCNRWEQLSEAVLDVDQNLKHLTHKMAGITA